MGRKNENLSKDEQKVRKSEYNKKYVQNNIDKLKMNAKRNYWKKFFSTDLIDALIKSHGTGGYDLLKSYRKKQMAEIRKNINEMSKKEIDAKAEWIRKTPLEEILAI
jgi:hypothetical protein